MCLFKYGHPPQRCFSLKEWMKQFMCQFESYFWNILFHCKLHFSYWVLFTYNWFFLMERGCQLLRRNPPHISQIAHIYLYFLNSYSWTFCGRTEFWRVCAIFVQSDVLDILLYISVNKMWTNYSILLQLFRHKCQSYWCSDWNAGKLMLRKVQRNWVS